ncbi:MAG: DinB family protein [Ignavibacteria bacterium]|nr:DinB family protein [Ignavibacteria bacterium]
MCWTLFLGPPAGNEVKIIVFLIALFSAVWIFVVLFRTIRRRLIEGALMKETINEYRSLIAQAVPRLLAISDEQGGSRPTADKWSKKEILGHLIDSATNNHQRYVRAQLSGEIKLPGYDQDAWVKTQGYQTRSWEELVQLWKAFNLHLLHVMEAIPVEKLKSMCFIGDDPPVTLEFLVQDYVRHVKHHLDQIFT